MLEIYTDGSAHPNPGPGGFGVIVLDKDKNLCYNNYKLVEVYSKQFTNNTTNNEQELKAILYAFLNYGVDKDSFQYPIIYSDSAYAINTYSTWMFNWAQSGWVKSDKKTPENLEIIQAYYNWYQRGKRIELRKIAGHQGNYWNEIADKLATGKMTPTEVEIMCNISKVFEKGDK
jgi:ribonuclease HI